MIHVLLIREGRRRLTRPRLPSDMKLHLQSTDYAKLLSSSEGDLTVSLVDSKLRDKLATEFSCLRSNALPPLSTFLDYMT